MSNSTSSPLSTSSILRLMGLDLTQASECEFDMVGILEVVALISGLFPSSGGLNPMVGSLDEVLLECMLAVVLLLVGLLLLARLLLGAGLFRVRG